MLLADTCYDANDELAQAVPKSIEHSHSIEHLCTIIDAMFAITDTAASLGSVSTDAAFSAAEVANHNVMMGMLNAIQEHALHAEKAINRLALLASFNPRLNEAIINVYERLNNYYVEDETAFVYKSIKQLYIRTKQ
jgi:hypothetical protein